MHDATLGEADVGRELGRRREPAREQDAGGLAHLRRQSSQPGLVVGRERRGDHLAVDAGDRDRSLPLPQQRDQHGTNLAVAAADRRLAALAQIEGEVQRATNPGQLVVAVDRHAAGVVALLDVLRGLIEIGQPAQESATQRSKRARTHGQPEHAEHRQADRRRGRARGHELGRVWLGSQHRELAKLQGRADRHHEHRGKQRAQENAKA
ncbi:MAG TPA: hypothetical protein VM869_24160 [Enhygromyxa sp.]|nr:hypothetical protein [Enhygromyxa sp.]